MIPNDFPNKLDTPQSKGFSIYGARMGRTSQGTPPAAGIQLSRVKIDRHGYDEGGAYWGRSKPLYWATDGHQYQRFQRASSKAEARKLLGLTPAQLKPAAHQDTTTTEPAALAPEKKASHQ